MPAILPPLQNGMRKTPPLGSMMYLRPTKKRRVRQRQLALSSKAWTSTITSETGGNTLVMLTLIKTSFCQGIHRPLLGAFHCFPSAKATCQTSQAGVRLKGITFETEYTRVEPGGIRT